ncbi:MAG: DUF411 domain-containing protein [Gemmatimonadaceae bacterium]
MRSTQLLAIAVALAAVSVTTAAVRNGASVAETKKPTITVYKDPSCGCCKNWIAYLEKHGYRVDAKDTPNMPEIKHSLGVPDGLTACHTAVVNGYLIEGHVPAEDIDRLLAQKPTIAGIAVPGMPMGSPGMDGSPAQRYKVISFDKAGKTKVFASH